MSGFSTSVVGDQFAEALAKRGFAGGHTAMTVSSGTRFKFLQANPAGSGVLACIVNVAFHTQTDEFFSIRVNPTTSLPTTSRSAGNRYIGGPAPKCTIKADADASGMGGGTLLDYALVATNNARNELDLEVPFILPPGFSVGLEVNNATGSPADVSVVTTWIEIPIT